MPFEDRVELVVKGRHYTLTKAQVLEAAERLKGRTMPTSGAPRKYSVIIGDSRLPMAPVVAEALGVMLIEVGGSAAYRALSELGFKVIQSGVGLKDEKKKQEAKDR